MAALSAYLTPVNAAAVLSAIAFLIYWAGWRWASLDGVGGWILRAATLVTWVGWFGRWLSAGIGQPPLTTLYESLWFAAATLGAAQAFWDFRHRGRVSGIWTSALIALALGLAALLAQRGGAGTVLLSPLLRSGLLGVHALSAFLAYSFFLIAAAFGGLALLKEARSGGSVGLVWAPIGIGLLLAVGGREFFAGIGSVRLPDVPELPWAAGALLLGAVVVLLIYWLIELFAAGLTEGRELEGARILEKLAALAGVTLWGMMIYKTFRPLATFRISAYPYRFVALTAFVFFQCWVLFCQKRLEEVQEHIPEMDRMDRWAYQAVLTGFPLLTLGIISGSVWAYLGWGRAWGWDPKEIGALALWFYYALYLHHRLIPGHSRLASAGVAFCGVVCVGLTFVGAGLAAATLHSFAQ